MTHLKPIRDRILLRRVRLDGGTQPRVEMSLELIEEIAELESPDKLRKNPVKAVYDGKWYWVWDGHHRTTGLRKGGHKEVWCEFTRGTRLDAVILSLSANADQHALRRSNADKRRAVAMALSDEDLSRLYPHNTDVAKICAVTEGFVRKVRRELSPPRHPHNGPTGSSYNTKPTGIPILPEEWADVYDALTPEAKESFLAERREVALREQAQQDARSWLERVEAACRKLTELFAGRPEVAARDRKATEGRIEIILKTARKYEGVPA